MIKNDDGSFTIEEADLITPEADVDLSAVTDETQKSLLQTEIAKKRVWREKAIEPTSKKPYKELYEALKTQKPVETTEKKVEGVDELKKDIAALKEESQKRVFQHANKLSPTQVDEVFAYAKGAGIEPKDALEKPFMKKVLDQMTNDEAAGNAALKPSNRAPVQVGGKTFAQMTPAERKAAFPSFSKSQ